MKYAVVTVSDRSARGEREDLSGKALQERVGEAGAEIAAYRVISDEQALISATLVELADELSADLILTTGGTGPGPREVTPEATKAVLDREMPGLAELLRFEGRRHTPFAVLSRGCAGIRGRTLIVNLPGHPKAVEEGWQALAPLLPTIVALIRGEPGANAMCRRA